MSWGQQTPPTPLNAEAARVKERQLSDQAARYNRTHPERPRSRPSVGRLVGRVRVALRAHRAGR
jgi:hypothetical protein